MKETLTVNEITQNSIDYRRCFLTWIDWPSTVMFWHFDPAKNAIQGDAPEGSDTF